MASPSLVQSKSATATGSTTITVMLDSVPTDNNLLVLCYTNWSGLWTGDASVTTPAGFTEAVQSNLAVSGSGVTCLIAYKIASSDSTTYTVTWDDTNEDHCLWVGEYDEIVTTGTLDVTAKEDSVGGESVTTKATGTTATLAQADNLCIALWGTHKDTTTGAAYTNSFTQVTEVENGDFSANMYIASKIVAATTAVTCTRSWTSPGSRAGACIAVFKANSPVTAPVNTVPKSGIQTTSATTTNIATKGGSTLSTIDSGGLTTARLWCTSGDITVTLSGSCTITAGSNGSSDLTIGNGASTAEFNTVLATAVYQGDAGFHGKDTINFVATGGGGSDTDTYYVLNDPRTLTVTFSTTYAQGVDAVENLKANLDVGNLTGQITMVTTDTSANSDTDTINIAAPNTVQNVHAIRKRRKRRKPSHNDRP